MPDPAAGADTGTGAVRSRPLLLDLLQRLAFVLFFRPFLAFFVGLRVSGREHLPAGDPFILIANHTSHLDTVSLLSLFPGRRLRRIRAVAAADYFERNAVIAATTRTLFNTLAIARQEVTPENDPRPRMLAALARGDSLILFPEGTRGSGGEIGRFRSGIAFLLEHAPAVPVVPAYLHNMGRSLPKGEVLPVPLFCEIRLGPPLHPAGEREAVLHALEEAVRALRDRP